MKNEMIPSEKTTMKEITRKIKHDLKGLGTGLAGIGVIALTVALQFLLTAIMFVAMLGFQIYHIIWPHKVKSRKKEFSFSFHFGPKKPEIEAKSDGQVARVELTLKNINDIILASGGLFKEKEIRQMTVQAVVETGKWTVIINEETRDKLGLNHLGIREVQLADGEKALYQRVGPLEICLKDRHIICEAMVVPDAPNLLIGEKDLEAMRINNLEEILNDHGDTV